MCFYTFDEKGIKVDTLLDFLSIVGYDYTYDSIHEFCDDKMNVNEIDINLSSINDSTHFEMWMDTVKAEYYDTSYNLHIDSITRYVKDPIKDTLFINDSIVHIVYLDSVAYGHEKDDIIFFYNRQYRMESPECGVYVTFIIRDIQYTNNNFDTIIIVQPVVDESIFENISIYF